VPASQLASQYNFTESESGGYSFAGVLSLGAPEKFVRGLSEDGFTAGTACSINQNVDAVIPGQLTVTNTTPDFNSYPGVALRWDDTTMSVEANFSGGAQCEDNQSLSADSTTADAPGQGFTLDFFVVLHNYYSPDNPNGDLASIAQVQLQITPTTDSDTGNSINPQTLSGPKASVSGGFYIPVDASAVVTAPTPNVTPVTSASPGATSSPSTTPAGWDVYNDPTTGFQISYPSGWAVVQTTDGTFFRDRPNGAYMLVAYRSPAGPSAIGAWKQEEVVFSAGHQNYHRVRMSGGTQQATWEYTYSDNGTTMHGIDDAMIVDNGQYGFALNWVTNETNWASLQPTFEYMQSTFIPPGG
jgi:hypothetical protein